MRLCLPSTTLRLEKDTSEADKYANKQDYIDGKVCNRVS